MLGARLGGVFVAVVGQYPGGFELVVRLVVGVLAFDGALEEADDVASAVGLLVDDLAEGFESVVLYVYVRAVWHGVCSEH